MSWVEGVPKRDGVRTPRAARESYVYTSFFDVNPVQRVAGSRLTRRARKKVLSRFHVLMKFDLSPSERSRPEGI